MIPIDLSGKTVIVTGASQGLGASTASLFHQAGANVVINYFDDPAGENRKKADALVATLGSRAAALPADVRSPAHVALMIDQCIARFGALDIIINNAGILKDRTMKKMTLDEWQAVIDTNLTGVFNMCKEGAERMRDGGSIISLSSIAAYVGFFGQTNYAAAKAGVSAMTKVLSRELAKRKIRVNAIAPGVVLTDMGKSIPEEARKAMLVNVPLGRYAEANEIASVALFLASDLSSYMTGQTLHVNGGWWS